MHAPYILSADDLGDFTGNPTFLEADDFLGAYYRKAMTLKKLWTLLFPHLSVMIKIRWQLARGSLAFQVEFLNMIRTWHM